MTVPHDAHPSFVGKHAGNNSKKLATTTKGGKEIARA